ncbi:hypothetical protein D7X48_03460 [bacterium D16-50]|jgi:predicted membrane protein|nr:cell wall-active antibiotics response protein [Lachnospiraceae bacterium]RKJ21477.1 hypothetical protein D7X48_03460 [bacterium D16-50]
MYRGKKSVFWAIMLILLAAALLASRLGYLEGIGFWPILFSAIFVAFVINGIAKGKFGTILFSIAFLIILNDEALHLEAITPWPVLGAALLCTIALKMLFPGFSRWRYKAMNGGGMVMMDEQSGSQRRYENICGSSMKYISGEVSEVNIENVFGALSIYFMDAVPAEGSINVRVESVFGSVTLYVPSSWNVRVNVQRVLGSSGARGRWEPDGVYEMYVGGDAVFGEVKVIYV